MGMFIKTKTPGCWKNRKACEIPGLFLGALQLFTIFNSKLLNLSVVCSLFWARHLGIISARLFRIWTQLDLVLFSLIFFQIATTDNQWNCPFQYLHFPHSRPFGYGGIINNLPCAARSWKVVQLKQNLLFLHLLFPIKNASKILHYSFRSVLHFPTKAPRDLIKVNCVIIASETPGWILPFQ